MPDHPLAIVTGATSGIGRCITIELARNRFRTVLIARRAMLLDELATQLRSAAQSTPITMNLADVEAIEPRLGEVLDVLGPASVVINCAGFGVYGPFQEQSPEVFATLKPRIVEFLTLAAGGPAEYSGRDLQVVHRGMKITNSEFDAMVGDIKTSMDRRGLATREKRDLLAVIESTRKQIVEKQ